MQVAERPDGSLRFLHVLLCVVQESVDVFRGFQVGGFFPFASGALRDLMDAQAFQDEQTTSSSIAFLEQTDSVKIGRVRLVVREVPWTRRLESPREFLVSLSAVQCFLRRGFNVFAALEYLQRLRGT